MTRPRLIFLTGFDPFENTTFESFFRLAARRDPGYGISHDPAQAALLIVNGDNRDALRAALQARHPHQRVLLIGGGSEMDVADLAVHPRPIRFMSVLAMVDKLMAVSSIPDRPGFEATQPMDKNTEPGELGPPTFAPTQPVFVATEPFAPLDSGFASVSAPAFAATQAFTPLEAKAAASGADFAATQPFTPLLDQTSPPAVFSRPAHRDAQITTESLQAYRQQRAPAPVAAPDQLPPPTGLPAHRPGRGAPTAPLLQDRPIDDVLVVDDSDVTLRFMQNRLGRLGFRVMGVRSGEEALAALPNRNYRFVFLDVMMDGIDGFQTCRAIKRRGSAAGAAPAVFLLSSRAGLVDKLRGRLSGADAYLTKPLNETDLKNLLLKYQDSIATDLSLARGAGPDSLPPGPDSRPPAR